MKKILFLLFLIVLALSAAGQRKADFGVFAGTSSYLGDINPGKLMYAPLPAGGIFYRYNLNPRQALRGNLFYAQLRADDLDFDNSFQISRAASFSGSVVEAALQFEFNFFSYSTQARKFNFSPYLAAGVGLAFINSTVFTYEPVIPFSLGLKVNVYKNIGLEAEYGFRKTFYDNFDGLKDLVAPSDVAWLHNNDWYSFTGLALTWKLYSKLEDCPAYADVNRKKRRK
jgi:hypothetical protein